MGLFFGLYFFHKKYLFASCFLVSKWIQFFFIKPNIKNISLGKIKLNEYDDSIKFDMIITKNKEVLSNQKIFSKLISSLNPQGVSSAASDVYKRQV